MLATFVSRALADDLTPVIRHAVCVELWSWRDSHFRPDPAHMQFISR